MYEAYLGADPAETGVEKTREHLKKLVTVGLLLCVVIGLPLGITAVALGFEYLTLPQRRLLRSPYSAFK